MHPRGQASAEYVGVVLLVAVVLAALTAVGAPWLPGTVVDRIEHAICVVGLDVCDARQARAEGLEPCVTSSEDRTRGTAFLIGVVDTGGSDRLLIQVRSDGSYLVTASHATDLGATAGVGLQVKELLDLDASVSAGAAFGSGTVLEVPDATALRALLGDAARDPEAARKLVRRIEDDYPADRVTRYRQLDPRAGAEASASLRLGKDTAVDGFSVSGGATLSVAVGKRTRAGVDTYYYDVDAGLDGPLTDVLPAETRRLSASWQASRPPVLTVTDTSGARGMQRVVEARMVLRDPKDEALARRWLLDPRSVADPAGRALAGRLREAATIHRFTYAEQEVDEGAWGGEAKLGAGLGMNHLASVTRRQLVDARLLNRPVGGRRLDCLRSTASS